MKKEKDQRKSAIFWQTAMQPKEALLRVLVALVILFVCAGQRLIMLWCLLVYKWFPWLLGIFGFVLANRGEIIYK